MSISFMAGGGLGIHICEHWGVMMKIRANIMPTPSTAQWILESFASIRRRILSCRLEEELVADAVGTGTAGNGEVGITTKLSPKDACGGARICAIALLDTVLALVRLRARAQEAFS